MQLKQKQLERQITKALHNWEFNSIENIYKYAIQKLDSIILDCHGLAINEYDNPQSDVYNADCFDLLHRSCNDKNLDFTHKSDMKRGLESKSESNENLDSKNADGNSMALRQYVYMGYVNFLYQIGKFDEILAMLGSYNNVPEWWDTTLYDFDIFMANIKLAQNNTNNIDSIYDLCVMRSSKHNSKMLESSKCHLKHCKESSLDSINKCFASNQHDKASDFLPKEIQPYYFAHYISTKIKNQTLTPKEAMDIFEKLNEEKSIVTKAYIVSMLIEYFSIQAQEVVEEFFMPMQFESKQYLILTFLHSQCDTLGARIYWDKFNTITRELLQKELPRTRKRLAVAFYGVLRGAWQENLQEILDITIKPLEKDLEVDCFLFSWDEYQQWSSLMGGEYWVDRIFNAKTTNACPQEIAHVYQLRDLLPNVYDELQSEYNLPVDCKKLEVLKKHNPTFKQWKLESQENQNFNFHNAKLMYNYRVAFNLIQNYEREKNIEYDYVMLLRSDIKPHPITANDIYNLLPNEIADSMRHFGSGHGCIAGWRESVKNYVGMWDNRETIGKNKYIASRSIGDNHEMGFKYPALFNCRIVKPVVTCNIRNTTALKSICFPDIKEVLERDLKTALENNIITEDRAKAISDFFYMLMRNYKRPSKDSRIYYRMSNETKDKRMLYYALGEMALKNANLLGYIKIPFKHAKIKKRFDIRQSEVIPNIKETLEYKVGKALSKVNKNWYRGSYLWFYDKMRRLKKKHK